MGGAAVGRFRWVKKRRLAPRFREAFPPYEAGWGRGGQSLAGSKFWAAGMRL